jgi:hypothetical protein
MSLWPFTIQRVTEEEAMRPAPGESFGAAGLLARAAIMFTMSRPSSRRGPRSPPNLASSSRGFKGFADRDKPGRLSRRGLASAERAVLTAHDRKLFSERRL